MVFKISSRGVAWAFVVTVSNMCTVLGSTDNVALLSTPPMGFNNWARFKCNLNESLFVETADAMASNGLLAAGYNRLNMDDCWLLHERSDNGSLQWDPELFPRGLIWLSQYVKSKGFQFGIYEDAGAETCGGYPGSRGYEEIDFKTFTDWGIDYLKLDGCNVSPQTPQQYRDLTSTWHGIISSADKPLILSQEAPTYFSQTKNNTDWYAAMEWSPSLSELGRVSYDISTYGDHTPEQYWNSIISNYNENSALARYQQPGYYNDPDVIIADWPITLDERKSQFALWASMSSPLIISADIPNLTVDELAYLTNKDVIAIDQDALTLQATFVSQDENFDVLTKGLSNGDRLLTVLNRGNATRSITIDFRRLGLTKDSTITARDLWTGKSTSVSKNIKITLNTHATAIYRLSNVGKVIPTGQIFNTKSYDGTLPNCLTESGALVTFNACSSVNSQVWTVSARGAIRPLSAPQKCLSATAAGARLQKCSPSKSNQHWTYSLSGNLVNKASQQCIVVGGTGVTDCGAGVDSQVFGLPSGVKVVQQ